ncbi:hypothetical protein [Mycobacterium deserti]|uniref:Uncharacterized protein n=1 Tax=Mycobacterium deserti TaxID=2978347 RepID=A0ABT2MEV1_9MYCO|nr:hypothetical protein [Mycobacterium deserti]MCT7660816.1 hypothetical protein [Mycobacterium deserti]
MPTTPDEDLADAIAAMQEWGSLHRRLNAARLRAQESAAKAAAARARMAVEARDVAKLESMSFTTILAHLKGSHSDDLAREMAEHQAAEYEYLTLQARADADERVVEGYGRRLGELGDVKMRHKRALAAKEQWLRDSDDPAAAQLGEIAERRGVLEAELAELDQATDAGLRALEHLCAASEEFDSARSWSAYDTWFDGGVVSSMVKQGKLDAGVAHMRRADAALKRFATELADVDMTGANRLELGKFTRIFDVWFDNIFSDLAVRSTIIDGQDDVAESISGVKAMLTQLRSRRTSRADELLRLQAQRAELLESKPARGR